MGSEKAFLIVRQDQLAIQRPAGQLVGLMQTVLLPLRELTKVEEALDLRPSVAVKYSVPTSQSRLYRGADKSLV